jgi:hypothetical protein
MRSCYVMLVVFQILNTEIDMYIMLCFFLSTAHPFISKSSKPSCVFRSYIYIFWSPSFSFVYGPSKQNKNSTNPTVLLLAQSTTYIYNCLINMLFNLKPGKCSWSRLIPYSHISRNMKYLQIDPA